MTLPTGVVEKPKRLTTVASEIWDELAPIAISIGTLTPLDVVAFSVLCELEASRWLASQQKNAEGFAPFTVAEDYTGTDRVHEHKALASERTAAGLLPKYLAMFRLQPMAHGRVPSKPPADAPPSGAVPSPEQKRPVHDFAARARARLKLASG